MTELEKQLEDIQTIGTYMSRIARNIEEYQDDENFKYNEDEFFKMMFDVYCTPQDEEYAQAEYSEFRQFLISILKERLKLYTARLKDLCNTL